MLSKISFHLRIALRNLSVHKKRMVLALLGILFACMSLVSFGNISKGLKAKIEEEIKRFGENLIIVRSGIFHVTGRGASQFSEAKTLKIDLVRRIGSAFSEVETVIPFFDVSYPMRYGEKKIMVTLIGTESKVSSLRNVEVAFGGFFDENDEQNLERKAVIGFKVYENLFFPESPIGKSVFIFRAPTQIVGVMSEKGTDMFGQDQDIIVYMPLSTFMRRYSNVDYVRGAYIRIRDGVSPTAFKAKLREFIRSERNLRREDKDDFSIFTPEDIMKTKEEGVRLVSILTVIASIISFLIGGLGIFAIMLLSVTERSLEIGIRRAVGATKRDVILQFIAESTFVSLLGGILGILLGLGVTLTVDRIGDFPFVLNLRSVATSLFICAGIGICAGIYPAIRSSKYEPSMVLSS